MYLCGRDDGRGEAVLEGRGDEGQQWSTPCSGDLLHIDDGWSTPRPVCVVVVYSMLTTAGGRGTADAESRYLELDINSRSNKNRCG